MTGIHPGVRADMNHEHTLQRRLDHLVTEYRRVFGPKHFDGPQIGDFRKFMRESGRLEEAVALFEQSLRINKPLAMDWFSDDHDNFLN